MKGPSESQSMAKVDENGSSKESNPNKMVMEVQEGVTGLVGDDLESHGDGADNHELGGMDKEGRVSCFVDLGVQNSSLGGGIDLVPAIHQEHVHYNEEGVGLSNNKKKNTWTRFVHMDVGPMGIIK